MVMMLSYLRCGSREIIFLIMSASPSLLMPIELSSLIIIVDLLAAIDSIPSAEAVIYNQIVFLPNQKRELALLDKKKMTFPSAIPMGKRRYSATSA